MTALKPLGRNNENLYIKKGQLSQLKQQKFKLEKDIQRLFEENLTLLSGYIFIRSEFSIKNSRIDTLAFDPETQAFVIIEYKKTTKF